MKEIQYILFLLFSLLFFKTTTFAQSQIDSLDTILNVHINKTGEDTTTLRYLKRLYTISRLSKPYLALEYAGQALQFAQKKGDSVEIANWHERIGDVYYDQKVYYLAMKSYFECYKIYNAKGKKTEAAYSQISIGDTYLTQNVDDIANDYYKNALETFKNLKNKTGIALAMSKIGLVNLKQFNYDNALANFTEAIKLSGEIDDVQTQAQAYAYSAEAYKQMEDYGKAIDALNNSLIKFKIINNKEKVGETYFSLGEIFTKTNNLDRAKDCYEKANNIFEELGAQSNVSEALNRIANIYYTKGDLNKAIDFSNKALDIANENGLLNQKRDAYYMLSTIHTSKGNIKTAFDFLRKYSAVKDSIWDAKKQEQFTELQVSLETQKQEKEIEILKRDRALQINELKRKQTENYGLIAGAVVMLLFVFYVIRNNRKIKHTNDLLQLQYEEINIQKQEIQSQAENLEKANVEITSKKNEIEEKNKKITSSITYASRIQKSMLPDVKKIKSYFKDCFILFMPKEAVSGDFYWFSNILDANGSSKTIIAAIDCTGHGVPGAFMSVLADAYLNQIVNFQKISAPDRILNELHKNIRIVLQQEQTENNDGMDIALCVIDKKAKKLEFAGAKNPLVYIQNNKVHRINGNMMSIGGMQKEHERIFTKSTIDISIPTTFYIYSDGFQDQLGGQYFRKYMAQNFRQLLFDIHQNNCDEQAKIISNAHSKWMGENKQNDDILVIGVKI